MSLGVNALRSAVNDLKQLVERRAPFDAVTDAVGRVATAASELDRLAPDASILALTNGFARHISIVAHTISSRHQYPDHVVASLAGPDFAALVERVSAVTPVHERAAILRSALTSLEGLTVEFKETFPAQTHTLAKEFAALAPVGGSVFLGIADDGSVVGLDVKSVPEIDEADRRLRSIAASVDPPVVIATAWLAIHDRVVAEAWVNPSEEPIHFVEGRAYLRDGSASRPARQAEVKRAIHEHQVRRPLFRIEPNGTSFLRDVDGSVVGAFAHVRITNLSGFACPSVRAYARFAGEHQASLTTDPIPLRWSSSPEPMTVVATRDGLRMVPDVAKVPLGFTTAMQPADVQDVALAVRFARTTGAWGWTGESYVYEGKHPNWRLPPGRHQVEVSVRAEGRDVTAHFWLETETPLESFAVFPFAEANLSQ